MGGGRKVPKSGAAVNSGGKLEAGGGATLSVAPAVLASAVSAACASVAFSPPAARPASASVAVSTFAARLALASRVLFAADPDADVISRAPASRADVALAADTRASAAASRWPLAG